MSEVLFGRERSGTPPETRGATTAVGERLGTSVAAGDFDPFSRDRAAAVMSLLGFNPADLGLGDVLGRSLEDPGDRTAGLFASLIPFERRQTAEAVEGLRAGQGALGGRFGRTAVEGETDLRGRLAGEFQRNREGAVLQAQGQQNQALAVLFNAILGSGQLGQSGINALLQFLAPGRPNFQEGISGDLLAAGGTVGGAFAGRNN